MILGKGKISHKVGKKILRHYTRFQAKHLIAAINRDNKKRGYK